MKTVGNVLRSLGIKAPWKVGVAGCGGERTFCQGCLCSPLTRFPLLPTQCPLQYTGPASSPEYLSHLPKAVDYRSTSPV